MAVQIKMPNGGDETVEPESIFVLRETSKYEKEENPDFVTCLWGGGYKLYSAETLDAVVSKVSPPVKFARLTAPNEQLLLINMENVVDRDEPLKDQDSEVTRSVLAFSAGPTAPRIRVRETKEDLVRLWTKAGVSTAPFD